MKKELDELLVGKYPPLYRDRNGDMRSTAMVWGFEIGDGWFNIINALSAGICSDWRRAVYEYERIADKAGKPLYEGGPIVSEAEVAAAKKKMDDEAEKVPSAVQVKEKFGTLRFYLSGSDEKVDALVEMAENLSAVTCETCGAPGALTKGGWISCKCDACREEAGIMSIAEEREFLTKNNDSV